MEYGLLRFEDPKIDCSRKILHVDMDAFYASIEARDNPSIAHKPIIIAKHPSLTGGRGIVSTCNYLARQFGVHSAMPAIEAYRLCPQAIFVQGNMGYYRQVSQQIRTIFSQYTDLIEPLSLDEAYLDVTENKKGESSAIRLAQMIQKQILDELNLTCSIGISYNKFIAKIASDYQKPFGMTLVTPESAPLFLQSLPIEDFYGVGKKSIHHFHRLGIFSGRDLLTYSLNDLMTHFGKMGYSLYFKVRGIHNSPVCAQRERKSKGREMTFQYFLDQNDQVEQAVEQLSRKIMADLKGKDLLGHTLTLKIRYDDFETITRQLQTADPIDSWEICLDLASQLWQTHGQLNKCIRLLGIAISQFEDQTIEPIKLELS
ncbi:DNA polymerase IV [Vaginisenegalia massiliensis]|uniref:DNA polymerase IV n=1 Tax=Vaginisenegalia massiliensis TaxID=2058294 RepID=UPI000F52C239|nr:DNA polymerase IV [Vaginisenegalia massiliensis]